MPGSGWLHDTRHCLALAAQCHPRNVGDYFGTMAKDTNSNLFKRMPWQTCQSDRMHANNMSRAWREKLLQAA
jgi:hypothetical protein